MLNVTNGDCAVARLRSAGVTGDILPWRDTLHEGPVGAAAERARFIADRGWAPFDETLAMLTARDERLARAIDDREDITLWFETDLYDVLQLAQIADRVHEARIVLVGVDQFRGVAELSDDEIRAARPEPFDPAPDGLNRSQRALLQGDGPKEARPFLSDVIAADYLEGRVHPRAARYDPETARLV